MPDVFFDDFVKFFTKISDWLMEIDEKPSKIMKIFKIEPQLAPDLIFFHDFIIVVISMFFDTIRFSIFFVDFPKK